MEARGLLDCKDFEAVGIVFSFVAMFIDWTTGYVQSSPINGVHIMYTEFVNRLATN